MGNRSLSDDFLREIAKQYLEIAERWYARNDIPLEYEFRPVRYLERIYDAPNRTVQAWCTAARKLGYLPKTPRGRVSK